MFTIGLDLHKRETQLCIGHEDGTIEERRIVTSRDRFSAVLGDYLPARILLEASTESEWVARHLEQLGHEVIVADPNFAPMYATRTRRTKTDHRDAHTLMDACRAGTFRKAHRAADDRRHVRAELAVREAMVRTRTRYIAVIKALIRRDGLRLNSTASHVFAQRIAALDASPQLRAELQPLLDLLVPLNAQIDAADDRLSALEKTDAVVALLMSAPGIGPVTASAVVATIDDITRFAGAHQFEAYLGLVPGEKSSGEKRRIGPITKAGQCSVCVIYSWKLPGAFSVRSRTTAQRLERGARRSPRGVAGTSRPSRWRAAWPGYLFAMWRDNQPYNAQCIHMPRARAVA